MNEYEVLQLLMGDCREGLAAYRTSLEEDTKLLQGRDLSTRERLAARLRVAEKTILSQVGGCLGGEGRCVFGGGRGVGGCLGGEGGGGAWGGVYLGGEGGVLGGRGRVKGGEVFGRGEGDRRGGSEVWV